ncbi:MAG: selenocysteine-specific translation elongation factor [Peptoniphilus sp.]|nr:selenocysteine-specific translation elongation factor [Peptoniphilus sp.]MDY3118993.1 selenocysteine-specific translation elongation factor [Peptoniphilus sp.]
MKNVIVGTAGHVDHGKTTLLKAMTGVDLDTLKEEKKRGITINPGYSTLKNDRDLDIGIIDVPGHEKFVHNMLTGIGGVDLVLLLVSAEEGIMPQTREHFEIVKALGVKKGILVLTKIDLVDKELLPLIEEEVKDMVKGSFLEGAPLFPVSAYTGENVDALTEAILDMAETCDAPECDKALTRLPVDRVFSVAGHGTVITGTLIEGAVEKGDPLLLYPAMKETTVRSIQVHSKDVAAAYGGQRVALNVTLKKDDIDIGDVLAPAGSLPVTEQADVAVTLFDSTERIMENSSRVHMNYGSGETIARIILFGSDELHPGEKGYAQLRMESPIPLRTGDPFVLRFFSPVESIAGGQVLEVKPKRHKRKDPAVVELLKQKEMADDTTRVSLALAENRYRYETDDALALRLGFTQNRWRKALEKLRKETVALPLTDDITIHRDVLDGVFQSARDILARYHEDFPLETGMPKQAFRQQLMESEHTKDERLIEAFIRTFYDQKRLADHGMRVEETGFTAVLTEEQKKQWTSAEIIAKRGGFAGATKEDFKRIGKKYEQIVKFMTETGTLIALPSGYVHKDYWDEAVSIALQMIEDDGELKLGNFRNALDTSRKYAVELLEEMDKEKITVFKDGKRIKA